MPLTYKSGVPADRTTAVYEARVTQCGPGHGHDKSCRPSEALIQAHRGGPDAVAAVLKAERSTEKT